MSRTRHERLQELFLEVVDLPPEERRRVLDRSAADPELRREVEELLAADGAAEPGPGSSAVGPDRGVGDPELVVGSGAYRLGPEIGRGGMGIVHLAERADGAFRRQVAVKVLRRPSATDPDLVRRFRTERRVLAGLDHPAIARLLDGGEMPDGSPFLVMEYVEGEPITDWVERRGLAVEERVGLFLEVCDAVQAAHQSLVVHRDLKPANVLVTPEGRPKLLDFGIAKLLAPADVDWTLAETRPGGGPLTPRFASPEQLRGGPITTATDVWALGVLLHELLTGTSPHRPPSGSIHDWIRAICELEPVPPSRALALDAAGENGETGEPARHRTLRRRLAGDLDHIVAKALRRDPSERYATAADLAADLRRHLGGLPVRARAPTVAYRLRKLVRRRRWTIAAALVPVGLAIAFTIGLERELRRTEVERDKARRVTELLVGIFEAAGPGTAEDLEPSAREILDRGVARLDGALAGQPEVEAALLEAVGRVYNNLGEVEEAWKALERAVELRRASGQAAPLELAESLDRLTLALVARGDLARAETTAREALALTVAAADREGSHLLARQESLRTVLAQSGRHAEAAALGREIVDRLLERLGVGDVDAALKGSANDDELVPLANALGSLATSLRQLGLTAEAEEALVRSVELSRRLFGDRHYAVAFGLNNLANVLSDRELWERSVEIRDEALEIAEAALGPRHPALGSLLLNQGHDRCRLGHCDEGLREITRAEEIFTGELGPEHPVLADVASIRGQAVLWSGDPAEAARIQREALAGLRARHGADHPESARAEAALARALDALGRHREALEVFTSAGERLERALGAQHPATLECRSSRAETLLSLGEVAEARRILEEVVAAFAERPDLAAPLARARERRERAGDRDLPGEKPGAGGDVTDDPAGRP